MKKAGDLFFKKPSVTRRRRWFKSSSTPSWACCRSMSAYCLDRGLRREPVRKARICGSGWSRQRAGTMEVSARICEGTTHPVKVRTLQHVLHNKCSQQVLRNRCCTTGAAQQVPLQWRRDAPEWHRVSRPRPARPRQGFAPSGRSGSTFTPGASAPSFSASGACG